MSAALIALIRTTLVALRLQAASSARCMNGDLVIIIDAQNFDDILKRLIGLASQLEDSHAHVAEGSDATGKS